MGNSGSAMRGSRRTRNSAARASAPSDDAGTENDTPRRISRVSRWFGRARRRAATPPPASPNSPALADVDADSDLFDGTRAHSRGATLSRALSQHAGGESASGAATSGTPFASLRWPPLDAAAVRSSTRSASRLASRASSRASSPTPSSDDASARSTSSPRLLAREGRGAMLPSPEALLARLTDGGNGLQPGVHLFYTGSPAGEQPGALMVVFVSANAQPPEGSGGWVMYLLTVNANGDQALPSDTYEELLALQERLGLVSRGASAEAVQALPMTYYRKGESHTATSSCRICLHDYEEGDGIRQLPCEHDFHVDCVDRWLTEQVNNCPLCRTEAAPRSNAAATAEAAS